MCSTAFAVVLKVTDQFLSLRNTISLPDLKSGLAGEEAILDVLFEVSIMKLKIVAAICLLLVLFSSCAMPTSQSSYPYEIGTLSQEETNRARYCNDCWDYFSSSASCIT